MNQLIAAKPMLLHILNTSVHFRQDVTKSIMLLFAITTLHITFLYEF